MRKKILLAICGISALLSIGCFAYYHHRQTKAEEDLFNFAQNSGIALLSNSLSSADMITLTREMKADREKLSDIKLTKWITTSIFGVVAIACGSTLLVLKRKEKNLQ